MKSCFTIVIACFITEVNAQFVTIPDPQFATYLRGQFPDCMDGNMLDTVCAASILDGFFMNQLNIYDLTGVQYFKNLTYLYCTGNNITSLPPLPPKLQWLNCSFNQLTSLPLLPDSIERLECNFNQLTWLPQLPSKLDWLECGRNNLTSLPSLPPKLTTLICGANPLSSLPSLPSQIGWIDCAGCSLTVLPPLPDSLERFECFSNLLTELPPLPPKLGSILCYDNRLISLPDLPDYLHYLDCSDNPDLACLPKFDYLGILVFDNTAISCVPSYNATYMNPLIGSLPLCGSEDSTDCTISWNIGGKVYFDANSNCINDSSDRIQRGIKVNLLKNGVVQRQFITPTGYYSFDVSNFDTYQIMLDSIYPASIITCPDTGSYLITISASDSLHDNINFGIDSLIYTSTAAVHAETEFINVYPNPANNQVTIACNEKAIGGIIQLVEITGKAVITTKIQSKELNLQTAQLSPGLYFVKYSDEKGNSITKKLIKE